MAGVTEAQCAGNREDCDKKQAALIAAAVSDALAPVGRIEGKLDAMAAQMSGLIKLYDRVRELEVWRAGLDARASANDAHPHKRDAGELEHLHRRITDLLNKAELIQTASTTKNEQSITIPRWVLVPVGIFIILVLAIAMIAGERGLWTVKPHITTGVTK